MSPGYPGGGRVNIYVWCEGTNGNINNTMEGCSSSPPWGRELTPLCAPFCRKTSVLVSLTPLKTSFAIFLSYGPWVLVRVVDLNAATEEVVAVAHPPMFRMLRRTRLRTTAAAAFAATAATKPCRPVSPSPHSRAQADDFRLPAPTSAHRHCNGDRIVSLPTSISVDVGRTNTEIYRIQYLVYCMCMHVSIPSWN